MRGVTARVVANAGAPYRAAGPQVSSADYAFLVGRLIDRSTLARAESLAATWGVKPHEVMIAAGWVSAEAYCRALAADYDLPFAPRIEAGDTSAPAAPTSF